MQVSVKCDPEIIAKSGFGDSYTMKKAIKNAGWLRPLGIVVAALTIGAVSEIWHGFSDSCLWVYPNRLPGPCTHPGIFSLTDFIPLALSSLAAMFLLTALSGFANRWGLRLRDRGGRTRKFTWISDDERRLAFCLAAAGASTLGTILTLALWPAVSSVGILGPWWTIPRLLILASVPMISVFALLLTLERMIRISSYYFAASVGAFIGALWGILSRPAFLVPGILTAIVLLPPAFTYAFCLVGRLVDRKAPLSLDGIVWYSGVSTALFVPLLNFREFIVPLSSLYATLLVLILLRTSIFRKLGAYYHAPR